MGSFAVKIVEKHHLGVLRHLYVIHLTRPRQALIFNRPARRSYIRINLEVHGGTRNILLAYLASFSPIDFKDEGTRGPIQLVGVKFLAGVAGMSSTTVIVGKAIDMNLLVDMGKIAAQYFGNIDFLPVAVVICTGRVACLT